MNLRPQEMYHVYNRGNNRQRIFYNTGNYHYFLQKVRHYLSPNCDILAYCLMPNHFHLLVHANDISIAPVKKLEEMEFVRENNPYIHMSRFSHSIQLLLSSYAKAINQRHNRSGSLFKQNTKAKQTSSDAFKMDYSLWCFIYIHNNPVVSGLVTSPEKWPHSSYHEYLGKSTDPICNLKLGRKLLDVNIKELKAFNDCEIPGHIIDHLF